MFGGGAKNISESEMVELLKNPPADIENYYTKVSWGIAYKDACSIIIQVIIPSLLHFAKGDYENTLLVFGFDS